MHTFRRRPEPWREALNRLSAERPGARTDQRGFTVAALPCDRLPVFMHNRFRLASVALRESIEQRDAACRFRQLAAGQSSGEHNEHSERVAVFEADIEGRADDAVRLLGDHSTRTAVVVTQARACGHAAGGAATNR